MRSFNMFALLAVFALSTSALAQGKAKKEAAKPAAPTEAPAPKEEPRKKESVHDQYSGGGYGTAGCGLGSIVFGPKPGIIQVIAATINGTAGSQTFGITSGTSNCDIPEMGHQAAVFIEVNKEIVMKDAARGQGETIANLSEILNCNDSALLGQKLQQNYEKIFNESNSTYESTRQILNTIKSDAQLAPTCNIVG